MKILICLLFLVSCSPKVNYQIGDYIQVADGFYKGCVGHLVKESGAKYLVTLKCFANNKPYFPLIELYGSEFYKIKMIPQLGGLI